MLFRGGVKKYLKSMCVLSIIVLVFLIPLSILHRSHLVRIPNVTVGCVAGAWRLIVLTTHYSLLKIALRDDFFAYIRKKHYLRLTPPCFQQGPLRILRSHFAAYSNISARPFPYGVGSLRKRKGCRLSNHDYFFHACASIIRLNNPILCEHNRLI